MVVVSDQGIGAQLMDEGIDFIVVPIGFFPLPMSIEPDASDFTIIGQQFSELSFHEIDIAPPICVYRCTVDDLFSKTIIITAPIQQGIVKI